MSLSSDRAEGEGSVASRRLLGRPLFAMLAAIAVLATVAVTVVTLVSMRSPLAQTIGDLGILAASTAAAAGCLLSARRGGPAARGWWGLTVAGATWSAGQLVWIWYGLSRGHAYPFPSLADLGYIGYSIPAVIGLLLFPRSASRRFSAARAVLDACVVAGTLLFISWATVLGPTVSNGGGGLAELVSLGYPLGDVLVASMVLTLGMRVPPSARRPWLLMGSGLLLLAVTDSIYVSFTAAGSTGSTGTPLAGGWMAAWLLVAFAGSYPPGRGITKQRHFTVVQELLPLAPALAAVVVGALQDFRGKHVLITTGVLALTALAAQQVVGVLDKVKLANGLEEEVQSRTAALRSAEARFGALVSSSDEAIVGKSLAGIVTSWNLACERLYGYPADEVLGRSINLVVPAELQDEEESLRLRAAQGEQVRGFETVRLRKDGTRVPVALTVSPIHEDDVLVGISAIGHDITERKRHEVELTEARTRALTAASAKTDFLATMSHEIRTPMNGVIGLTGLLLDTPLDETQQRYAAGVRGAGEALLGIIDDILDFSKLEAGKVLLESTPFDPRALVDEVGVLMSRSATDKGLELVVDCTPAMPTTLLGDPGRLRQVLINLTANAIKFTAQGEVVVRARMRPVPGGVDLLELSVSDTGIGVDPADQERLFEPFSQADASTTRRFGGTGLGLAICRRLVLAMDGVLTVESALGVGSTFTFAVPLSPAESQLPPLAPSVALAGLRVLVVDDNDTNRLVLHDQLKAWDVVLDAAPDALAGWALLQAAAAEDRCFDVALLDMCMPDVDGLELAERIAAEPTLAGVRSVILTSAGSIDRQRLEGANVRACMNKPVRTSELHDILMQVAAGIGPTASTRVPPVAAGTTVTPAVAAPTGAPSGPSKGRVLVVEDNHVNQMVAEGVLHSLGYEVDIAENGRLGLDALAERSYAAVLMDCHMPEMDGFEATIELRRREGVGRHTPVLAMTAGVLAEDRERCQAAGMDDFVAKPINVQLLAEKLARWTPDDVLDRDQIDTLRGIGPDDGWGVLPVVIEAFVGAAADDWKGLSSAGRIGDKPAAQGLLHRLKGAAANVGATRLVDTCARLETEFQNGNPVDLPSLEPVRIESDRACRELSALLVRCPAAAGLSRP